MRRSDREITNKLEIIEIIEKCDVCRLAFSRNNVPYIVPMNFGYEYNDGNLILYFHGAAYQVFYEEFVKPINYPATTGYIEIVGVVPEAREKGIAKEMLNKSVELNPQYSEFVLNVTDINVTAIKLYEGFGFVEYERIPYKYAKQAGFNTKIYMKYTR